ncbi:MAG TPA: VWA domain-containing protein, partial [Polyangiaceae bacterium]|nr:VWA domain-containing protein [Polyangiaceae bacterium]
ARLAFDQNDFVPGGDLSVAYELASAQAELRAWAYQPERAEPEPPTTIGKSTVAESRPVGTVPGSPMPVGTPASTPAGARPPSGTPVEGSDEALGIPPDAPFVAMALKPALPLRARYEPRDYVLVVDTSRSMVGENYRRATQVVTRIIREMDRNDRVSVLGCDSTCVPEPNGMVAPGDAAADAAGRFLEGIEPEGASDLALAIERAASVSSRALEGRADATERRLRIVYLGDGTPTVGPIHPALLERAVGLALPRGASLNAVAIGSDADRAALRTITRAGGGVSVSFAPGQSVEDVAFAVLGATYGHALEHARLELPDGLVRVMPASLGSIAAGAEELVVMRMTAPRVQGDVVLTGEVAGERFERHYPIELEATSGAANAFVPRLYASVAIDELEGSMDESARRRSIDLSTRFNVASRYTSLLVLESPAMFNAFGLDNRRAAPEWTGEIESQKQESTSDELAFVISEGSEGSSGGIGASSGGARSAAKAARAPARESSAGWADGASEKRRASSGADDGYATEREYAEPPAASAPAPATRPLEPISPNGDRLPFSPPDAPRDTRQPFELPERRMVPMRRVWDRVARIDAPPGVLLAATPERRQKLEMRLHDNPDSRDALRSLFVIDFLAGDLDSAAREVEHWADKDPLDIDALTARADLAAQRGQRDLAIRILGSVVDVRPGDYKAQWRLARLHRWAGNPERGCRHSLAVAQLMLKDAKLVSEAVGCLRDVGQGRTAEDLLAAIGPNLRSQVELLLQKRRPNDELSGDFKVQATWQGSEHDVDVVIVHPDGYRVSWLGAPTRAVISASDVLSVQREGLSLRGAEPGQYAIELVRSSPSSGPIQGSAQLSIAKAQRTIPFVLEGERVRIALVSLKSEARLVPLDAWE